MVWVKRGAQFTAGSLVVLVAALLLYAIRSVLVIVLLAVLLAEAIAPLVMRLHQLGARRSQAVLLIYAVLACAVSGLAWLLAQAVARELGDLAANLPQIQAQLATALEAIPIPQLRETVSRSLDAASTQPPSVADGVPGVLQTGVSLVEAIFAVVSVLVIAFYWTAEQRAIQGAILGLLPPARRNRGSQVWADVDEKIGAWVRSQLVLMGVVGGTFAVGLSALGVHYAVLLGALAACAELLPVVGPWIGTAPAVLIALTQSPTLALAVLAFGVAVQLFETNVLVPRLMGHAIGISPLVVFISILAGAELLGVFGALLAVPVAAGLQVLLHNLRAQPIVDARGTEQPIVARDAA